MALTDIDRNLLTGCLNRDPGAWTEFVDRFAGLFHHVIQHAAHCRSITLSPADVDDLLADVFLELLANNAEILARFRGDSSLSTYLTVIARRVVVHEMIRQRMAEELGHVRGHGAVAERSSSDASDGVDRIDNRELVQRMLEGLSESEATVVRLYHLEGRTYNEIAEGLKMPENSVGPVLTRAREKLRKTALAAASQ